VIVFFPHKEPVCFGDRNTMRVPVEHLEGVARLDFAFSFDRAIETAAAAEQKALQHVIALKFGGQLVAWSSRLADHHNRGTDLKPIADVKFVFRKACGREVLAKHAPGQIDARQLLLPIGIMLGGIGVHRLVGTAVDAKVGLAIAIEVQGAQPHPIRHGLFEDSCVDRRSLVDHEPRAGDVKGYKLHAEDLTTFDFD
jgi:hypothetical protein